MAALAYAHVAGETVPTVPTAAYLHWNTAPDLPLLLLGVLLLYAIGLGPGRRRLAPRQRLPRRQALAFALGITLLYGTLASPIDAIGEQFLFSVHMLQHLLLLYPVPILLWCGMPAWLLDPFLRPPACAAAVRWLTTPLLAAVIYNLVLTAWHIPGLYEWALRDRLVHNLEHVTFLLAALLMWWPLLSPTTVCRRRPPGIQALYLLALAIGQLPVFAYITFAQAGRYPTYAMAARLVPLTPLEDQQLGGILMQFVSMAVLSVALAVAYRHWYKAENSQPPPGIAAQHRPLQSAPSP
jgi:putative membrane protein